MSIDGKAARVETATWVGELNADLDGAPPESTPLRDAGAPAGPGRLIVFLFQKDFEMSRLVGLMRMLLKSRAILDTLTPDDRVAILSFDFHLEIWSDFTNDRERLDRILADDLLLEQPPAVLASPWPSLIDRLDPDSGRRTYGIARARIDRCGARTAAWIKVARVDRLRLRTARSERRRDGEQLWRGPSGPRRVADVGVLARRDCLRQRAFRRASCIEC